MAAQDDLYDAGLQIYLALDAIVEHTSDGAVAVAIGVVNEWEAMYQNGLAECWAIMQPYLHNYNPDYAATFQQWVPSAIAEIYAAINPVIMDGNANGGHYNVAVIAAQTPAMAAAMAIMNSLRNPLNFYQYETPFTDHH